MILAAKTHWDRVKATSGTSAFSGTPTEVTVFTRLINRLDVYKTHTPSTQEDMRDILMIAKALQQAAGG